MAEVPTQVQDTQTTKINLHNDVTVNGIRYKAGHNVEVPKNQADDILRIDYGFQQYEKNLMKKNTYEVDAGTIGVGGGGE